MIKIIIILLLIESVFSLLWEPGVPCARHAQCLSGKCLQHCCENLSPKECAVCFGDGKCWGCNRGFKWDNFKCVVSNEPGAPCLTDTFCQSGVCLENCCHPHPPMECTQCNFAGKCQACKPGHFLTEERECKQSLPDGELCESYVLNQCVSGKCRERCCSKDLDPKCDLCSKEKCLECVQGFTLKDNKCIPSNMRDGAPCLENEECSSKHCIGGFCCNQPGCLKCNKWGVCDECKEGYELSQSGMCIPPNLFQCAKNQNIIRKRFCSKRKKLGERCCWSCDEPCRPGLECSRISPWRGVCTSSSPKEEY